jgi:lipoprotein-anchoring transpeptidase ErfK/SrfK
MFRKMPLALLAGACCLAAGIHPAAAVEAGYPAPQVLYANQPAPAQAPVHTASADRSNMGGGFIQFLFGGAMREPTVPRAYQAASDERAYARSAAATPDYGPQQASMPDYGPQQAQEPAPARGTLFNFASPQNVASASPQDYAPSSQGDATYDTAHPAVDPKFDRQVVDYRSTEKPGTLIIDTPNHFLYLVQDNGRAMRYGIGVGKPGFTWQGVKTVSAKKEWPDWFPPPEMIQRRPDLPRWMAGGPENPLGARAMYLGSTLYRIHGSNEPWTIGGNVSSGCIRLRNADVIDLYGRVQVGTKVVIM